MPGWTQSWITITLGLKLLNTTLWDVGQTIDGIEQDFEQWVPVFFPPSPPPPPPPPPLPCIPRAAADGAAVQYNLSTTLEQLCAPRDGKTPVTVLYKGAACLHKVEGSKGESCSPVNTILWESMRTLDPRSGQDPSTCTWSRGADPNDIPGFLGYQGIPPTAVQLPMTVCS